MMRPMSTTQYDCLIAGGGLVGTAQAIALAQAGLSVGVVERVEPDAQVAAKFDGRVSAIAHASVLILQNTGVWPHVAEKGPINDIRVTDGDAPVKLHFDHKTVGEQPFGYMVENRHLRAALFARAKELDTLHFIAPRSVEAVENIDARAQVVLDDGTTLTAPLLLAADGRFSNVRDMLDLGSKSTGYGQTAIVVTIEHTQDHEGLAVEHFLTPGPFAILPIAGGKRSAIVWTETDEMAAHYMQLSDEAFLQELKSRCGEWLGEISIIGTRFSYPLMLITTKETIAPRAALIGDASHAIHPIAGQGVNLGFRDVAALTDILLERARLGLDIGTQEVLREYQSTRRYDTATMAIATDGLNRLFSTASPIAKAARRIGLEAVDHMPSIKEIFMREAMGLRGTPPSLMREVA